MKFLKNIATTGLVAATAIGFAVVAQPQQAQAASLRLIPPGSAVDNALPGGDPIRDLVQTVGAAAGGTTSFSVVLDTVAEDFVDASEIIRTVGFTLNWDSSELQGVTFFPTGAGSSPLAGSSHVANISGLNIGSAVSGLLLGSFSFNVLPGLNNDGVRDLWLSNTSTSLSDLFPGTPRSIEVQPAGNQVPTPALIPGIAAMGMGLLRRKKANAATA
jgi:hypothetical protein